MTDTFWTRKHLRWTVICQCTVTAVLLIMLLSLVIRWSVKRHNAFDQTEKTICVPCSQLRWSGNEDLSGFKKKNETDSDILTCCSLGSRVLDRLVEKHAYSQHKDLQPTRIISSLWDNCLGKEINPQKPYVKMTGLNFTAMENDMDDIIRWNNTEYEGDVKPMNGKIFIMVPGYYYVFSNLKRKGPLSNSNMLHSHYVFLHSYIHGQLKPILENSQSFCKATSDTSETTSTVGAVFQLEKYDKLFVQSSHSQHLLSSEYNNVFGLYMI